MSPMIRVGISVLDVKVLGTVVKNLIMSCQSCDDACDDIYMGTRMNGRGRIGDDMWNVAVVVAVSGAIGGVACWFC
jgi:hypothetical protein